MRNFIIKTASWFFLFISIYFIIGLVPFAIFDRSYPIYKSQLDFIDLDSSEILFIGDSRVNSSIISNNISDSRNLGLVGSSPIDGYFILKRYLDSNKETRTVFISYDWGYLGNRYDSETIYRRGVLMGLYGYKEHMEILEKSKLIDKEFSKNISWNKFISAYIRSPIFIGTDLRNFQLLNYQNNKEIFKLLNTQQGYITSIWGKNMDCINCKGFNSLMHDFQLKPIYNFYLQELIKLCISNNIRVIFETIPFNKSSKTRGKVKREYQQYLTELSLLYPNAELNDTIFYYEDKYFESPGHMNTLGAIRYTRYLKSKILEIDQNH